MEDISLPQNIFLIIIFLLFFLLQIGFRLTRSWLPSSYARWVNGALHWISYLCLGFLAKVNFMSSGGFIIIVSACYGGLLFFMPQGLAQRLEKSWLAGFVVFLSWLSIQGLLTSPMFQMRLGFMLAVFWLLLFSAILISPWKKGQAMTYLKPMMTAAAGLLLISLIFAYGFDYWQTWLVYGAQLDSLALGLNWGHFFSIYCFFLFGLLWSLWPFSFFWVAIMSSPARILMPMILCVRWVFFFTLLPVMMALISSQNEYLWKVIIWVAFSGGISSLMALTQAEMSKTFAWLSESLFSLIAIGGLFATQWTSWPLREMLPLLTGLAIIHLITFISLYKLEMLKSVQNNLLKDLGFLIRGKMRKWFSGFLFIYSALLTLSVGVNIYFLINHNGSLTAVATSAAMGLLVLTIYASFRSIRRMMALLEWEQQTQLDAES